MSTVGQIERATQNRVVKLFRDSLGYDYLGNWEDREDNSNIEEDYLRAFLKRQGYSEALIDRALVRAGQGGRRSDQEPLRRQQGGLRACCATACRSSPTWASSTETVWLIDWENPLNNHFAIAEEVTVSGEHTKRPDVVLYVNGIALGVLELKRSIGVGRARASARTWTTRRGSSSSLSSPPCSWSWPATTPRGCATASSRPRKSTT